MQLSLIKVISLCILLSIFPFSVFSSDYYIYQPLKTGSTVTDDQSMAYQSSIAFEVRLQMYPKNFDKKLIQYIKEECLRSQVPFSLICALIKKESQWYINCHSDNYYKKKLMSTDYGLMQLNNLYSRGFIIQFKDKFRTIESYDVINNPYDNVQIGIRHLRFLYDQLGNWRKSVMAYNAGIYRVLTKNVPDSTIAYVKEVCPIDNWWVVYRIAE